MSDQTIVGTKAVLQLAIEKALPGDTIVLKNGVWHDVSIELQGKGTSMKPMTIRAETPGEVVLTGASTLTFAGEYWVASGLFFKEGVQPGVNGSDTVVRFLQQSKGCRLSDTAIIDFHPSRPDKKYFWVAIDGSHHRVDHCYFKGKYYAGQLLRSLKYSSYNRIDGNYFVDIPPYGINGLEIIQVMGIGSDGEAGSAGGEHVIIENNLFERADGECEEVISLKSNHDTVRNNTFKESIGGLVIRSGHNTVVEGNYFIGGNVAGTKGIRITGEDNVVSGNYLTGLQGFGISIMSGEYIDEDLTGEWQPVLRAGTPLGRVPMYNWSKRNIVTDNVLVRNAGVDIDIGIGYKSGWPSKQRVLLPESNRIAGNVIVKDKGEPFTAAEQDSAVLDIAFAPNEYGNNRINACMPNGGTPGGFVCEDIALQALDNGLVMPALTSGTELRLPSFAPLTDEDAGPEWAKRKRKEGEPLFQPRDQFATAEQVPWNAEADVVVLCSGSSDLFVRSMRMKLDVRQRDMCPFLADGETMLPIRAVAEKLGCVVTSGATGNEVRIRYRGTSFVLSEGRCIQVIDGREHPTPYVPVRRREELFLRADSAASLLGKTVFRSARGLVVLADEPMAAAMFENHNVAAQATELFKVTAASFEKMMTIPPEGRSHGNVAAYTLHDNPSLYWASFGDGQWIRYDLGQPQLIASVGIAFVDGKRLGYRADIEVSPDGFDWQPAATIVSASDEMDVCPIAPVMTRFVRIVGRTNAFDNANRIRKIQFYTPQRELIL